ncbi:MAG: hypothetical protein JWN86_1642 [Planctomycetota bacterium]|nr:hypothetical protein [Planctomycetota bacterium]
MERGLQSRSLRVYDTHGPSGRVSSDLTLRVGAALARQNKLGESLVTNSANPWSKAPRRALMMWAAIGLFVVAGREASAQIPLEGAAPAHWIWAPSPDGAKGTYPAQTRYFRKKFEIKENGSRLSVDVTADNAFLLFLDGKPIARGSDWHTARNVEVKLPAGFHVLAAEVTNDAPGPAGFLLRGAVTPLGQVAPVHTDASWRTAESVPAGDAWKRAEFEDLSWSRAVDLGPLDTKPWIGLVFESGDSAGRFKVPEGFKVTSVASPSVTGSVVAFNFDEKGRPCVSIERGPIARLIDKDKDGKYDDRQVISPDMSNCQGFNFIRGKLYAVGLGPEGTGIYRLTDSNGDGVYEKSELVRATTGPVQEHGPHAIVEGPEGSLYYNNGNHVHLEGAVDPKSPSNIAYEGELLPHLPDPRGHANTIKAPCGEILRSDDDGKTWSRVSAGFRNHYDFAFNRDGEAFTFDSDMEWDLGLPWYRPVRVLHATPGAEFGSRNGSGVWPSYFFDGLPSTLDVGRGSPTGVTFYHGRAFPYEYDDNFLICDWSQGRILAVSMEPDGASYKAKLKELVSGQPLNCTDIEVGPDGSVYFTTGGRSTLGGLYKVEWVGAKRGPGPPTDPYYFEAVGMESPQSAFSRARVAELKKGNEKTWPFDLRNVIQSERSFPIHRVRSLDLLAQYGPAPDDALLANLSRDASEVVRRKAVFLLGTKTSPLARQAVSEALTDKDPMVRRRACEAMVRSGGEIPVSKVAPLLEDPDRWVRYAARVAVEHGDTMKSRTILLGTSSPRPQFEAMLAILRRGGLDRETQQEFLLRELGLLASIGDMNDRLDLLRLISLTYSQGPLKPGECQATPAIRKQLLVAFAKIPAERISNQARDLATSTSASLRYETARLLAFVNEPKAIAPLLKALQSEPDRKFQVHYAYCLRAIKDGWTVADKKQLWAWYETASRWEAGYSYLGYLDFMVQDLTALLSAEESAAYLADAARTPFPARVLVRSLDLNARTDVIKTIPGLYASLAKSDNPGAANELRTLILEKLGQAQPPEAHAALRALAKGDPDRRDLVARALCNHTTSEDLPNLVVALESRDPNTTSQVVSALLKLDARPEGPDAVRALLRLSKRTGPVMLRPMVELTARWLKVPAIAETDFDAAFSACESAYHRAFPDGPKIEDTQGGQNSYSLAQLLTGVLQSPARKNASVERGKLVLGKAKCLDCHKLGDQGQGLGPDLTTVASRFRPGEILESIVDPSKVISDQYKSTTVATRDGKILNGMPAGQDEKNLVLLLSDGTKMTIPKAEIDEQKESRVSVMPEGLVNALSYQDIADLLALFEAQPKVEIKK